MKPIIELYFVAICKHGDVLYAESGPYCNWESAAEHAGEEIRGACYRAVIKTSLTCEVCK